MDSRRKAVLGASANRWSVATRWVQVSLDCSTQRPLIWARPTRNILYTFAHTLSYTHTHTCNYIYIYISLYIQKIENVGLNPTSSPPSTHVCVCAPYWKWGKSWGSCARESLLRCAYSTSKKDAELFADNQRLECGIRLCLFAINIIGLDRHWRNIVSESPAEAPTSKGWMELSENSGIA